MEDFNSFFKTVDGNEGGKCHYNSRLDTYGCGCQHDCSYCYAKSLLDFRGLWNPKAPRIAPIDEVKKAIKKFPRNQVVRLGGMTDCFQPLEKTVRNTYKAIRLLNMKKQPYLIVTKSAMVADDEYLSILDKDLAHVQITVTTFDDKLCASYEKASPPSKRVEAIEKLQKNGFDVQLRLSPFIPQYVEFEKLNSVECDKILVEFLRTNHWIENWFPISYSEYTVKQNGYHHLPLERKLDYISLIKDFKEMSVCEDENRAYQYWQKHFNHNPDDCCNLRRKDGH